MCPDTLPPTQGPPPPTPPSQVRFPPLPGDAEPHDVPFKGDDRRQLAMAWVTTVHKAQGGEFPVTILIMANLSSESRGPGVWGGPHTHTHHG